MTKARTRADQKEQTRVRLLGVARALFTQHGYDETSIAMVCRRARVTHGALYHHYPGKLELFEAVLEDVTRELAEGIADATTARSGWDKLVAASDAFLDKCSDPTVIAVLLRDGPRVVPQARFDEIDRGANEPLVTGLLAEAMGAGLLRAMDVTLVARVLGAAFAEAGRAIAESGKRDATRAEVREVLLSWLEALKAGG